jgi:peptide/nickel transport system substrate-binding protein
MTKLCVLVGVAVAVAILTNTASAETLRVGRVSGAPTFGNPYTTVGQPSSGVWSALYDGLTFIDEQGKLQPGLSLSWQAVEPTRWIFQLRPNVVFHNGAPFDAAAVVAVIEFLKSEEGKRLYIGAEVSGVTSARAVDALTVEITTARPDPLLAKRMNIIYMVEPTALKQQGLEAFARKPVGTGPFKFVSWGNGNARNVFEAFPQSWRAPKSVTRLELLGISDPSARLQALQAGQIDIMEGIGRDEAATLDENFRVITQKTPSILTLAIRNVGNAKSPVQDPRVRQALSFAINRQAIAENILGDASRAATQGTVTEAVGYNPELSLPYNPVKARALLKEAGYAQGFALQVEVITGFAGADALVYQQAVQDLNAIGVKAELRAIPFPNWLQKFTTNDWGAVDAFSFAWDATMYYDPVRPIRNSSCAKANPFFCDPALTPLIDASDVEMDEGKRAGMMRDLMARLHGQTVAVWLASGAMTLAFKKEIQNVHWRSPGLVYEAVTFGK